MTDPRRALLPKIFGPILGLLILILLAVVIAIFYLRGPSDFSDNYRESSREQNGNPITTQSPLQRYQSIRANRMAGDLVKTIDSPEASNVSSQVSTTFNSTFIDLNENMKLEKGKDTRLNNSRSTTTKLSTTESHDFFKALVNYFYGSRKDDDVKRGFSSQLVHPPFSFLP